MLIFQVDFDNYLFQIGGKVKTKHDITWFAQKTNVRSVESSLRICQWRNQTFSFVYAIEEC
jgi:hypothetical protein